jgi:hypothetical protein
MGRPDSTNREATGVYRVSVGKLEGQSPLERPRRRWEDNEVGCVAMDWIGLAQDRDRWRVIVNAGSIKCGKCLD